jgi:hypothetical protein
MLQKSAISYRYRNLQLDASGLFVPVLFRSLYSVSSLYAFRDVVILSSRSIPQNLDISSSGKDLRRFAAEIPHTKPGPPFTGCGGSSVSPEACAACKRSPSPRRGLPR